MFDLKTMTADMQKWEVPAPIDDKMPRWMTEDYPGMEQDIAKDLYATVFWSEHMKAVKAAQDAGNPIPDPSEMVVRTREMATSLMSSVVHARNKSDAFDRAFAYLAWKVKQTGAYHYSEYDTVMEFLIDASIKDRGGELADIKFLLEDFFPMLSQMDKIGWSVEDVLAIQDNWSRTRAAIPFIRHATDLFTATPKILDQQIDEKQEELDNLEEKLSGMSGDEPDYTQLGEKETRLENELDSLKEQKPIELEKAQKKFNEELAKVFDVIPDASIKPWSSNPADKTVKSVLLGNKEVKIYPAQMTAIPAGSIFVMIVPSNVERAIQTALATIVRFDISDPEAMCREIVSATKKSPFMEEQ